MQHIRKKPEKRILYTAIRLFYNQGYNATGINQIIKEAQVAKASFYDHYPSKEQLAKKVLRKYQADIIWWLRNILRKSSTPDLLVKHFYKAVLEHTQAKNEVYNGCPVALFSCQFPIQTNPFQESFQQICDTWEKILKNYFLSLQKQNLITTKYSAHSLAKKILNIYEGCLIMWKLSGQNEYIIEFKQQLKSLLGEIS
ncbi:MAG: TetR/AcrR family transcriptional regulator [Spirochaetota bacterium]